MSLDTAHQTDPLRNIKNSQNHRILNSSEDEMPEESAPYGTLNIVKEKPAKIVIKILKYCINRLFYYAHNHL